MGWKADLPSQAPGSPFVWNWPFSHRFTCSVLYQGVIMHMGATGAHLHLDFLYSALMEFPASFFILAVVDRVGRRHLLTWSNMLSATTCFLMVFVTRGEF